MRPALIGAEDFNRIVIFIEALVESDRIGSDQVKVLGLELAPGSLGQAARLARKANSVRTRPACGNNGQDIRVLDQLHAQAIADWPETERPREKLLDSGPSGLSDAELLAIILRTGAGGRAQDWPMVTRAPSSGTFRMLGLQVPQLLTGVFNDQGHKGFCSMEADSNRKPRG